MNLNKRRILFFSYDAGGANVTMAYAYFMNKEGYEVKCYPRGPAYEIFAHHIPELIARDTELSFLDTDIVITGTSGIHSNYELEMIQRSKAIVSKVITILDSTAEFKIRFTINDIYLRSEFIPDEIWVEDGNFKSGVQAFDIHLKQCDNYYMKYLKEVYYEKPIKITNKSIYTYKNGYLLILTEYLSELFCISLGFRIFLFCSTVSHIFGLLSTINS